MKVPLPLEVLQSGGADNFDLVPETRAGGRGGLNESLFTGGGETTTTTAGMHEHEDEIRPVNTSVVECRSLTTLLPPPYLTRPVEYHPLHIFVSHGLLLKPNP